ncbi:MAG: hypothetical protein ACREFD_19235 [Stellaceae bacterium]
MTERQNEWIIAAIEEFRAKMFEAFKQAEAVHAASVKDSEQAIAAAKEFVTKANLFGAALEMYESTRHYHAWCKHDDWSVWNVISVTNVKEQAAARPDTSGFTWREHAWAFLLRDKRPSYSGDKTFATLSVECDGEPVMELRIVTDHDSEFDRWRLVDVQALAVGPWAAELTEMAATMELAKQNRQHEANTERMREQAARIKL